MPRHGSKFANQGSGERSMSELDIPDMCAHLDRLKRLCDRLEKAQSDEGRYREIAAQIRAETDALHATICKPMPLAARSGDRNLRFPLTQD
jgi:hypothetical protein